MNINVTFDASAASAPPGFEPAVNYVVSLFDSIFTNPVTINVDVGWGEVDGQKLGAGNLGESIEQFSRGYGYNQILNAVGATTFQAGDPIPANALSAVDPTAGGTIDPGSAGARALGLMPATSTSIDGWIGLSSTPGTFSFDLSNPPAAGLFDAVAVIEHELTEVMGRGAGLNPDYYSMQDLYRYSASGSLDLIGNHNDYFSIDKGATALDLFYNDASTGDLGDWAASAGNDALLAFAEPGVTLAMTTIDLIEMAALGWSDIPAILSSAFTNVLWTSPTSTLATTPSLTLHNGSSVPNPINQDANQLPSLSSQVSTNHTPIQQALATVEQFAAATTMVSSLTYEFFTGATPTAAGYQYLIDSPSNPNNLDSSYYAAFNIQNRYINFSVNLGKFGAGATPFNDTYGALSLSDAATKAYTEIFGAAPVAGKIDAILNTDVTFNGITETRAQYFAYYGGDGLTGIGTKAAMVGWLLEVATQDNLGPYAGAGDHFVSDLALGNAPFNIDLLPQYGYTHQVPLVGV
jgi:hypothetical protein